MLDPPPQPECGIEVSSSHHGAGESNTRLNDDPGLLRVRLDGAARARRRHPLIERAAKLRRLAAKVRRDGHAHARVPQVLRHELVPAARTPPKRRLGHHDDLSRRSRACEAEDPRSATRRPPPCAAEPSSDPLRMFAERGRSSVRRQPSVGVSPECSGTRSSLVLDQRTQHAGTCDLAIMIAARGSEAARPAARSRSFREARAAARTQS